MPGMVGAIEEQALLKDGVPPPLVQEWKENQIRALTSDGVPKSMIDEHFGIVTATDKPFNQMMFDAVGAMPPPTGESSLFDEVVKGFENSISSLAFKPPSEALRFERTDLPGKVARGAGALAGDIPALGLGGFLGQRLAQLSMATPAGRTVAGLAGSFAMAGLLRQALMDEYEKGTFDNFADVWGRVANATFAATKGAATGAITGAAGIAAAPLGPIGATGAEIVAMTAVGAKMEGEAPTLDDFIVGSMLIFGTKAVPPMARGFRAAKIRSEPAMREAHEKLRRIFVKTGKRPQDLILENRANETILEDTLSTNIGTPRALVQGAVQASQDPILGPAAEYVARTGNADVRSLRRELRLTGAEAEATLLELERAGVLSERPPWIQGIVKEMGGFEGAAERSVIVKDPVEARSLANKHRGDLAQPVEERPHIADLDARLAEKEARLSEVSKKTAAQLKEELELGTEPGQVRNKTELVANLEKEAAEIRQQIEAAERQPAQGEPPPPETPIAERTAGSEQPAPKPGSLEEAEAHFDAKIVLTEKGIFERVKDRFKGWGASAFYTQAVDQLHPLGKGVASAADSLRNQRLDEIDALRARAAKAKGEPPPEPVGRRRTRKDRKQFKKSPVSILEDAHKKARLNMGWVGKATHMLDFGTLRFDNKAVIGKSLREILEPHKKGPVLNVFRRYVVAHRALEIQASGRKSGFNEEMARRLATDPKLVERFEAARQELITFQRQSLEYLRDSGIISKESFDLMTEAGKDFMPFFRVMEDVFEPGRTKSQRLGSMMKLTGSNRSIHDPIESIIKNIYAFTQIAERNDVWKTWVKQASEAGRDDLAVRVRAKAKPIKVSKSEKTRLLKRVAAGKELTEAETALFDKIVESDLTVFRPDTLRPKGDEIVVFEKGERQVWKIDPEIADALGTLDGPATGALVKLFAIPAKALRAGSILAPEFVARNPIRDTFVAMMQADHKFYFVIDTVGGLAAVAGKTQHYRDWLKSGGPMAELVAMDRNYNQKNVRQVTRETNFMEKTINVVVSPIEALATFSSAMEQATRVGVFARQTRKSPLSMTAKELSARARGKPVEQARNLTAEELFEGGLSSRDASLDFGRVGASMKSMNMITAFFNANIQGADKLVRTMKDHPTRTLVRGTIAITLPSVILAIVNNSEENKDWYPGLKDWEKDLFWVWATRDDLGVPSVHRMPKPFHYGMLFGSLPQRYVDNVMQEDKHAFDGFLTSFMGGSVTSVLPTVGVPVLEQVTNHSFFMQRPLIPMDREHLLPEVQRTPYTTHLSQSVGNAIGSVTGLDDNPGSIAAPVIIDNYIRAWTGGLGTHVLNLLNFGFEEAGVLPPNTDPEKTWADIPFWKAFEIRYPSLGDQRIADFYEKAGRIEMFKKTFPAMMSDFRTDRAKQFAKANGPYMIASVENIRKTLRQNSKQISMIWKMPTDYIPKDEKRQLIDKIMFRSIHVAKAGNIIADKIIEAAEAAAKKAKAEEKANKEASQ